MSSDRELWNALVGIYAYDTGSKTIGIHDEVLRQRCIERVVAMAEDEMRVSLSRWLRDTYLSDEALERGYGWEDVLGFLRWIDDGMGRWG